MNVDTLDNKDVTSITARLASFLNFLKAPDSTSFGGNVAVKGIVTSSLQTHRVVFVVWAGSAQPARMRAAACLGSKEWQTGSVIATCYY